MNDGAPTYQDLLDKNFDLELETARLRLRCEAATTLLQGIVDGCVHPATASRRAMVDLTPIRAFLNQHPAPERGKE